MIGRDIGTVVLPSAELKVYLTASTANGHAAAARRSWPGGQSADLAAVLGEIEARDAIDSSRDDSPLRPAQDAWQLDTSDLSIDEVVDAIISRVEGR